MSVRRVLPCIVGCLLPCFSIRAYATMELSGGLPRSAVIPLPSFVDLYPEVDGDLTKVSWAHAVNDKKRLYVALRGKAMALEADVTLGKVIGDVSGSSLPVMAHPPITISDLTLDDFLDTVLDYSKPKGIKLDVKSIDVLDDCLKAIERRIDRFRGPLWLNADILLGPVNPPGQPVNPYAFIYAVKERIPQASLSIGWTTKLEGLVQRGYYTKEQVAQMRNVITQANVNQRITFPVRAALSTSGESLANLVWLLNEIPGSTLTVWSAYGDIVDTKALIEFIDTVGTYRVYIDVPPRMDCRIAQMRILRAVTSYFSSIFG